MGLFSRRSKPGADTDVPTDRTDAGIAALAARVATRLGATDVRIAGRDATDLRLVTGSLTIPLFNLIARLRDLPIMHWDELITKHVGAVLAGSPDIRGLTADDLRSRVRTRLFPDSESPVSLEYARPFAAGLVLALALDFPQTVVTVGDSHLSDLALDLDELYDYGRRNVNTEAIDSHSQVAPEMFVDEGGSLFVATRASDMAELLTVDGVDAPHGVLFTVPSRHNVLYTPISSGVLQRATTLVLFTQDNVAGRQGAVIGGPLSDNLYFWDADGYECVGSDGGDDESFAITITPRLQHALEAVGENPA